MSVINEALKKANRTPGTGSPAKPEVLLQRAVPAKRNSPINWGPIFVMAVLLLIVSPIVVPLFRSPYSNAAGGAYTQGNMRAQFAVEEVPIPVPPLAALPAQTAVSSTPPNFWLNGLVYSDKDSYCLINGKIVKLGETVGGATLIKVTPSQAVLRYEGRDIMLAANV